MEEQTEPMPEPTVQSEPQVIPSTPVAEETNPLPTEKETEDSAEQNSNSPVFIDPAQGGANPFENAPPTEIDDHPVDEFIGEAELLQRNVKTAENNSKKRLSSTDGRYFYALQPYAS